MAKGQLHSTGTICRAEIRCPIEDEGGKHFNSVDELVENTASETGTDVAELKSVLATGVSPAEAVSMAKDGVLGGSTPDSVSRQPKVPATITIDLSSASSNSLSERFLSNLSESLPVSSVKDDGTGRYTITVDAESDPNDYSVLMAASTAAENAASEMGYDEEEMEDFSNNLSISANLDPVPKKSVDPLKPAQVKELDQFDPAVHSVFSNAAARTNPAVAARALKKEVANGEWMGALSDEHADLVSSNADPDYIEEDRAKIGEYKGKQKASEARQAAMAKEMLWVADNDPSYKKQLPVGVYKLLYTVEDYKHAGTPIGTVRKAPAPKS